MSSLPPVPNQPVNPYSVAPTLVPQQPLVDVPIFRQGNVLIFHKQARLPDRCVKSNEPTTERLRRRLTWHHPLIYLVILANLLIYVIVALAVSKRADIMLPLSKPYKQRRIRNMMIAWTLVLCSIASLVAAAAFSSPGNSSPLPAIFAIGFPVLMITGALWGLFGCRVVYPKKIEKDFVYLAGCCPAFLDEFPNLPGT